MRSLIIFSLLGALACGDDDVTPMMDSGATPDAGMADTAMGTIDPDPDAIWMTPDMQTFDEAIPGVAWLGTVSGDRATGGHETFVRISAGMGLPPHTHTMGAHALVFAGPVMVPVPSNETMPDMQMLGGYTFIPPMTEHRMGCPSAMDCLFLLHQPGPFDMNVLDTPPTGDAERNTDAPAAVFDDISFVDIIPGIVEFGPVMGDFMAGEHGTIVRVAAGMGIPPHWHTEDARGFVLSGMVEVPVPYNQTNPTALPPGSYFEVPANKPHEMNCASTSMPCMFYLRQDGAFDFNPIEE